MVEQPIVGGLLCYRCKTWKPTEMFSPSNRRLNRSHECQGCKRERSEHLPSRTPEYQAAYYQSVKHIRLDQNRTRSREYGQKNRDKRRDYGAQYRQANRDLLRTKNREYKKRNRDKVNAYARNVRNKNPVYRIHGAVRRRIYEMLGGGKCNRRSLKLLGLSSIAAYRDYLESLFLHGMSWGNYGNGIDKWNIDHIKPLCEFDLLRSGQQMIAFHYTNTRPLWQQPNGVSGAIAGWRKRKGVDLISAQ